jgi:hypothetical protein
VVRARAQGISYPGGRQNDLQCANMRLSRLVFH